MKKIAVVKNHDDYRTAIIWRSKKASVYIIEYCDAKGEDYQKKAYGWKGNDGTDATVALVKALAFAGGHTEVKLHELWQKG